MPEFTDTFVSKYLPWIALIVGLYLLLTSAYRFFEPNSPYRYSEPQKHETTLQTKVTAITKDMDSLWYAIDDVSRVQSRVNRNLLLGAILCFMGVGLYFLFVNRLEWQKEVLYGLHKKVDEYSVDHKTVSELKNLITITTKEIETKDKEITRRLYEFQSKLEEAIRTKKEESAKIVDVSFDELVKGAFR